MSIDSMVNVDEMENKLSKISTLTKQLSKISSKGTDDDILIDSFDVDDQMDEELAATAYWKEYHDFNSKLKDVKNEIKELRNMNHEYTGEENFKFERYQKFNNMLERAIKDTNKSYKEFNGIDHEYVK